MLSDVGLVYRWFMEKKIECGERDVIVTRSNCLEFSGDAKNIDNCRSCENYGITRRLLIRDGDERR